jgi:hypothetical protein
MTVPTNHAASNDLTSSDSPSSNAPSRPSLASGTVLSAGSELDTARAALLEDLAYSLHTSQQALLARDLPALESNTQTQNRLRRSLETLWTQKVVTPSGSPPGWAGSAPEEPDGALAVRLRTAQWRVLHLGRVQAALLARAQRSLRMIAHLRAGLQATYAFPPQLALQGVDGAQALSGSNRRRP